MSDAVGWRSFWWLNVGMVALSLLVVIFMFPETKYHRPHLNEVVTYTGPSNEKSANEKSSDFETLEHTTTGTTMPGLTPVETAARDPHLGKGYPSKKQMGLYQLEGNFLKTMAIDFITPWRLFAYPIVEFSAFVASWSCSSFLTLNLTQSQAFAYPPYNFSARSIGFFNFAILIGALIGLFSSGPLSDWVAARATKKNKGIREPEMRLPAMIPYVIIM